MTSSATGQWLVSARGHRWFFDSGALSLDFAYTGDWGFGVPEWERLHGVDDLARWLDERFADAHDAPADADGGGAAAVRERGAVPGARADEPFGAATAGERRSEQPESHGSARSLDAPTVADFADALDLRAAISTLALLAARVTGAAAEQADAETAVAVDAGSGGGAGDAGADPATPPVASSFAEAVAADARARTAVDLLNAFAARRDVAPWLPGGDERRAPATASDALASIARDAVSLFAAHAHRIRECEGGTCRLVFVDTSRPGRRRWCSMSRCGGWAKARAHAERERRRSEELPPATG